MITSKNFKVLFFLAIIIGAGLWIASISRPTSIYNQNELFLPDLLNKINSIKKVSIKSHDQSLTIQKYNDNKWELVEKGNFPVLGEKIQEVIWGLIDLRIIEPKTRDPKLFNTLHLNNIEDEDSEALLISVIGEDDEYPITSLYVGKKTPYNVKDRYLESIYIRKDQAEESWLVKGNLPVSADFKDWVRQPLFPITHADISYIEIKHPNKETVVITKDKKEEYQFVLKDIKPGMKIESQYAVSSIPYAFADFQYEDVLAVNDFPNDLDWKDSMQAKVTTFDGMEFSIKFGKVKDQIYAKVAAILKESPKQEKENPEEITNKSDDIVTQINKVNTIASKWVFAVDKEAYATIGKQKSKLLIPEPPKKDKVEKG